MNILYTIDDNYVPQLAASICSICENNEDAEKIRFFVFSDDVSSEKKERLDSFVASYARPDHERTIEFIEIPDLAELLDFEFDTGGWNEVILARLLMGTLLPDDVSKVLYLDADTIVRRSLKDLWETDMGDRILGAGMEPTVSEARLRELGLAGEPYFNSGVLLVNLDAWRNLDSVGAEKIILDYYAAHRDCVVAPDQDVINAALHERILPLSPTYNFCNSYYFYPYAMLKRLMPSFVDEAAFRDAVADPVIVHYLGEERPWREGNTHRYKDDYLNYLSKTPFVGEGIEQGWELYFKAWRAFNFLMSGTPQLRYRIITGLIPAFLRMRTIQRKR